MADLTISDSDANYHYNNSFQYHCENGPAIFHPNGTQLWYRHGRLHRTDGPAVICADGTCLWYINGLICSHNHFYQKAAKLSDEDMLAITLKYGDVK
jgi:hypothetical protein